MHWTQAIVDRIVDETYAVLLVGPDETEVIILKDKLPGDASEGSIVNVRLDGKEVVDIVLDQVAYEETKRRIAHKMDLLRQRGRKVQE